MIAAIPRGKAASAVLDARSTGRQIVSMGGSTIAKAQETAARPAAGTMVAEENDGRLETTKRARDTAAEAANMDVVTTVDMTLTNTTARRALEAEATDIGVMATATRRTESTRNTDIDGRKAAREAKATIQTIRVRWNGVGAEVQMRHGVAVVVEKAGTQGRLRPPKTERHL